MSHHFTTLMNLQHIKLLKKKKKEFGKKKKKGLVIIEIHDSLWLFTKTAFLLT